jgi:hypothetical protein
MSSGSSHLPFAEVVDLVEGRLSVAAQAQAQAHTAGCARCAAQFTWLARVLALMRTDEADDPPAHVIARAEDLFRMRRALDPVGVRQRRPAALHFDSWRTGPPSGVRGGTRRARQLLFNAEEFAVDIQISQFGEEWAVAGQVLGPEQSGQVTLHDASSTLHGVLNELSEFKLSPVSPGTYTLIVQMSTVDVEISGLEVGV